ncbi:MAG: hypothetical protein ACE5HO_05230 [bacterium]
MRIPDRISMLAIFVAVIFSGHMVFSQPSSPGSEDSEAQNEGFSSAEQVDLDAPKAEAADQALVPLLSLDFSATKLRVKKTEKNSNSNQVPFSKLFKYDTSPSDPAHHCYEIVAPVSKKYKFQFYFLSADKYKMGG